MGRQTCSIAMHTHEQTKQFSGFRFVSLGPFHYA